MSFDSFGQVGARGPRPKRRGPGGGSLPGPREGFGKRPAGQLSVREELADDEHAIARGRRERMRERMVSVVSQHRGAHSRRENGDVKGSSARTEWPRSGPSPFARKWGYSPLRADPLPRRALAHSMLAQPDVHALCLRGVDPALAVDVQRGHTVAAEDLQLAVAPHLLQRDA